MSAEHDIAFITPTWAGDLDHFRVMRASLEQSPLAPYRHYAIVQSEDLPLFKEFQDRQGLTLLATSDVLPEEVERRRVRARVLSDRFGRNFTRICGSLKRQVGWPVWPSYTGWHTQQLCKLKLATELGCNAIVVIDSDVVVTPNASPEDFTSDAGTTCFAEWKPRTELTGKVRKWVAESERLVGAKEEADPFNVYFDTPFVFDRHQLAAALSQLEDRSGKTWWQAFLDRPPRRWSEFGFYKAFLSHRVSAGDINWKEPAFFRYIYDTSQPDVVVEQVAQMIRDPGVHYVTVHSQASGREAWDASAYLEPLASMIRAAG